MYIPYTSTPITTNVNVEGPCASNDISLTYVIVNPLPTWISFTADSTNYIQTLVVNNANALAAMTPNKVTFTSTLRVTYQSVNYDALFELTVYKCPDPNCITCISYNIS